MRDIKNVLKSFAPEWASTLRARWAARALDRRFRGQPAQKVFSTIYQERLWSGPQDPQGFCSGAGSHEPHVVEPYVRAVLGFLAQLPRAPDAVDLGCGDFNVGRQVRPSCARYVACDIVPELIAYNASTHAALNVDFRVLDLIEHPLPSGEVLFLRQVLQHLGNEQVAAVTAKLHAYRFVVLTEHLPTRRPFAPNVEKPAGPGTRLAQGSGIVLTEPPFRLRPVESTVICSVEHGGGTIETTLYRMI